MRWLAVLLFSFDLTQLSAQARVSVAQLEQFLSSRAIAKEHDEEIARRLGSVELGEQLSETRLVRLLSPLRRCPKSEEQLKLLAIASVFEAPPNADLPSDPLPDEITQERMLALARTYIIHSLRQLPDFIAIRRSDAFATVPPWPNKTHADPVTEVHFVHEQRREIMVRGGHEVVPSLDVSQSSSSAFEGLTTRGEFGPVLATIFGDTAQGTIVWSRWQDDANGTKLAVFHYAVPKAASHDLIDLCCYLWFHDAPAYHGDLYIDPESGGVLQLTLVAEIGDDAAVRMSKMAVRYGPVKIGGLSYICPLRGVAVGIIHDDQLEKLDGVGLERFINVVDFTDYHKFGSTARILTSQ